MRRAGTTPSTERANQTGHGTAAIAAAAESRAAPTLDAIRTRAYELYLARGGEHGEPLHDWLRAEREILLGASEAMGDERNATTTA